METLEKKKVKRTDIRVVEIDESNHWKDNILKACGGKITTVYMYDAKQVTCLCEAAPSYWLYPLYCNPENSLNEIDANMADEFQEGEMSMTDGIYVHCSQIDKMDSVKAPKSLDGKYTQTGGKKYNELWDNAFEYLRGNHII